MFLIRLYSGLGRYSAYYIKQKTWVFLTPLSDLVAIVGPIQPSEEDPSSKFEDALAAISEASEELEEDPEPPKGKRSGSLRENRRSR